MALVRPWVHGNALRPELLTIHRHLLYIRNVSATCITEGSNLVDIQRLLKLIIRKKLKQGIDLDIDSEQPLQFYIDLDINDYKKKKIEYLKELAKTSADEVSLSKEEKVIGPLPAYERRIIHLELQDRENIFCESIGEEPERSVVIRIKT